MTGTLRLYYMESAYVWQKRGDQSGYGSDSHHSGRSNFDLHVVGTLSSHSTILEGRLVRLLAGGADSWLEEGQVSLSGVGSSVDKVLLLCARNTAG